MTADDELEPLEPPDLHEALREARARFGPGRLVEIDLPYGVGAAWGEHDNGEKLKSLRFGQYIPRFREVRIHRRLWDVRVPQWLVEFVVFHELVHAALGHHRHTPEFRTLEARHPRCADARAWEAAHITSILSATWSPPQPTR